MTLFELPTPSEGPRRRIRVAVPRNVLQEARRFGGWTASKLDLLDWYLRMYKRVAGNATYIDGFAGTGHVEIGGQTRPGSASIALASKAFKQLFLYEQPKNAKKLLEYLQANFSAREVGRCTVTPGDFNEKVVQHLEGGVVPPDKPCFAFLDPNSTQLQWSTLEAMASYKGNGGDVLKVELFVLLNTHQALMRLMPTDFRPGFAESPGATAMDRVMGGREAWWDLYEQAAGPGRFAARYAQRMVDVLGYGAALPYRILDPSTKRPQYYMVQASDHPAAFSFMQWAEKVAGEERHETPRLFTS